jgi:hypothetical protein
MHYADDDEIAIFLGHCRQRNRDFFTKNIKPKFQFLKHQHRMDREFEKKFANEIDRKKNIDIKSNESDIDS